jgi:hypothetical protein
MMYKPTRSYAPQPTTGPMPARPAMPQLPQPQMQPVAQPQLQQPGIMGLLRGQGQGGGRFFGHNQFVNRF